MWYVTKISINIDYNGVVP